MSNSIQRFVDVTGILVSVVCMVHCFAVPVLAIMLPWAESLHAHGPLLSISFIVAGIALLIGYKRHGEFSIMFIGIAGVALSFFGSHGIVTLAGSLFLVVGHALNYIACRNLECGCHEG